MEMAEETETVDEAEELIAQLLAAQFQQGGDETGDNSTAGGEGEDEDEDDDEPSGDEGTDAGDEGTQTGEQPDPAAAEGTTPDPATPPPPGPFDSLTADEKAALLRVRSLLTDNPDIAEGFDKLVKNKFSPEPDKTLPEWIDPEDETSVKQWEQIQEIRAEQQAQAARAETTEREAGQRTVQNDIAAAVDRFKVAHPNLTDEDITHIRVHTGANVNMANVMSNFPGDPVEGIVRSMEIGSMTDPATRDKVLGVDPKAEQDKVDATRKKNLTGLSGSSGSGRRTTGKTKKPANWNEVSQRLAKELEDLGGL